MSGLQVTTGSSEGVGFSGVAAVPRWLRLVRGARSAAVLLVFFVYLLIFLGLSQRLIVFPLVRVLRSRRSSILGRWIRLQALFTRGMVRAAGTRFSVRGSIPPGRWIVVMNHQSVVDIAIALCETPAPALIPVRTRYRRGIPGISPYLRAARYPFVEQTRKSIAADLAAVTEAADRVADGETSMIIFPEGHRTKDGEILPFMRSGLQIALQRSRRPVYCIVADGMWRVRTMADAMVGLAGRMVDAEVIGPFMPPENQDEIPQFIESLRQRMIDTLHEIRTRRAPDVQP